ncbi:hypothetical protein K438DRAFT_1831756 [Mycena galopus ATCC 62051]|nr:hypothetical protein K438DRAFT_1831756 [Mycena galopus ATCC 62051]
MGHIFTLPLLGNAEDHEVVLASNPHVERMSPPQTMISGPPSPEEDPEALTQWTLFLRDYSKGIEWASPPPPLSNGTTSNSVSEPLPPQPNFEVPLYPPGEISPETARTIAKFYDQHGFLPPPRADEETVRLQTIQEYNLFRQDQAENFHRCSSLVNTLFPFAPVCTISLFHNAVQVVVSKAGDFPVSLGEELVTETSICGHVVLKKNGETTELAEIGNDWRFTGNPWCSISNNGVRGYVGVPITLEVRGTLEVDPSIPHESDRVTVGVIALMSNTPFKALTVSQRKVLDDLSSMLSVQLRSTWEGWRRGKEMRLSNAVTDFIQKALVDPSQQAIREIRAAPRAGPPVQGSNSGRSTPSLRGENVEMLTAGIFANAAERLQKLLEADFAVIVNLTSFHATTSMDGRRKRSHSWLELPGPQARRRILGTSSSPAYTNLEDSFDSPEAMAAIARFLDLYFATGRSVFGLGSRSGLEGVLSALSPPSSSAQRADRGVNALEGSGAVAHIAVPFYSANRPNILIVVATTTPFFTFNPADVAFAGNLGVMLVAHLAQRLIVEADAAKTAFVSKISHELRTPLHGLLGQLDLVRDSFASGELSTVPALLDSAEYCGTALRGIVDDVLHFGEMQAHDGAPPDRPRSTPVDLAQVTLTSVRSCWLRQQQWRTVSAPSGSQFEPSEPASVKLVVEFEDRSLVNDWWLTLDAPGFIQILNNLVTNSLKYTAEGLITVSLVSGSGTKTEVADPRQIILRVEDTGRGIAPEFVHKLFDPFTQADSFSPGAGLGLHITKTIIDRMGGAIDVESRLGGGSIFTVALPVDGIELLPTSKPRSMRRTYISSEQAPKSLESLELPPSPSRTPPDDECNKRLGDLLSPHTPISPTFVRNFAANNYFTSPVSPTSVTASNDPTTSTSSTSVRSATHDDDSTTSSPQTSAPSNAASDKRTTSISPLRLTTSTTIDNPTNSTSPVALQTPTAGTKPATSPRPTSLLIPSAGDDEHEPHLRILIVDDNVISRKLLVALLKRLNATAYQADDGINAIEVFREVQPHVVWTDVSMPRMDGVTAAREMRKIERERGWAPSYIVAITGLGLSDEHIRREALLGPAALDGWLFKGQNIKTLKEGLVSLRRKLRSSSLGPSTSC